MLVFRVQYSERSSFVVFPPSSFKLSTNQALYRRSFASSTASRQSLHILSVASSASRLSSVLPRLSSALSPSLLCLSLVSLACDERSGELYHPNSQRSHTLTLGTSGGS